jgi:hypothetical protein
MDELSDSLSQSMELYRYNGKWYKVSTRQYESERQSAEVAWLQIREPSLRPEEAYRRFFQKQREDARILYPSFRKDAD